MMAASRGGIGRRGPLVFRKHDRLTGFSQEECADLKDFALENQTDQAGNHRPVLAARNGQLHAQNYVGVIETQRGTVLEILPKVDFGGGDGHDKARQVFLNMLRTYRGLRTAQFNQTGISALHRFNMLEAFVQLFLDNLALLTKRGLARHYNGVEDNLPRLRGRILFPQHIRHNAANRSRFYVGFKEIDGLSSDPKHGVSQGDIYQLYAYGRKYGCPTVALIYPRTQQFNSPLSYEFIDEVTSQPLTLLCLPFDVEQPQSSVENVLQQLTDFTSVDVEVEI